MKKVRSHQGSKLIDLYPTHRTCPNCGEPLVERYRQSRFIVTLSGMLRLNKHVLECQTLKCTQHGVKWRPEGDGALALPHYTFGLDVVARVGELRYREQQTIEKIATALGQQGVSISHQEIQLLSEVFLALVETVVKDDAQVIEQLRAQGGIILSIDG
ncbi:MAG TPA: hypothetical protein VKE91_07745, partial [Blastocatellia bacterium]|nr:hypothetical protein [Blastocatellia bacterium]